MEAELMFTWMFLNYKPSGCRRNWIRFEQQCFWESELRAQAAAGAEQAFVK